MKRQRLWVGFVALWLAATSIPAADWVLEGEQLKQERLGFYYFGRGDMFGAMQYLLPLAEAGHPLSQYRVGTMEEAATNFEEAESWYRKAIDQGLPEAAHALAGMYANGYLGQQDLEKAYELQRFAAEKGYVLAMNYVANALAQGIGVDKDEREGLIWYRKAAEANSVLAIRRLIRAHQQQEFGLANDEAVIAAMEARLQEASDAENEARLAKRKADFEALREIEKRYLNSGG